MVQQQQGRSRQREFVLAFNLVRLLICSNKATKGLAAEYGQEQIRVNALLPLLSGTGLFESFVGVPYTPQNVEKFVAQVPLGRLTEPIDVANAARKHAVPAVGKSKMI